MKQNRSYNRGSSNFGKRWIVVILIGLFLMMIAIKTYAPDLFSRISIQ